MKKYFQLNKHAFFFIMLMAAIFSETNNASAQTNNQMVRLAKIVVDSLQLDNYKAMLQQEIETSIKAEPGVKTLYAVSEKNHPTHITILEIYADSAAYKLHIQSPHFIKYKTGTKDMIRSLELNAVDALLPGMKIK